MHSDRVNRKMKERGKQISSDALAGCGLQLARKTLALLVVIVPAFLEQVFQQTGFLDPTVEQQFRSEQRAYTTVTVHGHIVRGRGLSRPLRVVSLLVLCVDSVEYGIEQVAIGELIRLFKDEGSAEVPVIGKLGFHRDRCGVFVRPPVQPVKGIRCLG